MKQKLLTLFAMLLCGIHGAWAVDISGTVNASSLPDNAEVVLTGNTNINMDVAKTIKSLQADYPLTISGDNVLSVINEDGNAIFADGDIKITGGNVYVGFNTYSAVCSYNGDITLYCNLTAEKDLAGNENIIYADRGNITTNGTIVLRNGRVGLNAQKNILIEGGSVNADVENRALLAIKGTITISGDVTAKAGYNAIEAYGDIIINDVTISGSAGYNGNFIYSEIGNISTRGTITVDRGRIGLNADKNIIIEGGSVNADVENRALLAIKGTITISGDVTAKAGYNAIEASGDIIINGATVSATTTGDNVKAIISESGNVVLTHANIVTPENGSVSGGTIIDSNGDPAKSIYIVSTLSIYTEFVESTGTLTYYYDDQRESRIGKTELYDPNAIRFADYYNKVQKAVIDESMQYAPLTSMEKMFYGGFSMKPLYLSKMTSIEGLENLNTSDVTNMQSMFEGCQSLTELDLSTFNTANVTNTNCMFQACVNLETLNIALFNIGKMEDMRFMFAGCSKLKTIYCNSNWSGSEAQSDYMFSGCSALEGGQGTTYNNSKIDKSYARPDDPDNDKPGYFTVVESVAVNIGATEWATFVAPYALNFLGADGLTAYIVTGHTGSTVETTEVYDVPANTPVC